VDNSRLLNNGSGGNPSAVIFDSSGNFYGTQDATINGLTGPVPALVYEMSPNGSDGWNYTVLYSFSDTTKDGDSPSGGLVRDAAGNLYGTTLAGGSHSKGVVYEITP
jgi:uncharacterized repeat protein (TIGR03803 family)